MLPCKPLLAILLVLLLLLLACPARAGPATAAAQHDPDPPIAPAQAWQIGIYLVTAFCLLLAAAGGVGAVAMLVTLFIIIGQGNVPSGMAVGMLSCVFAGTGIVHVCYYSTQKHPVFKDRALIDPNLLLLITAPGVGGMALGGLANRVSPVWLVYVCLVAVMLLVSYSLCEKSHQAYKASKASEDLKRAAITAHSRSFGATTVQGSRLMLSTSFIEARDKVTGRACDTNRPGLHQTLSFEKSGIQAARSITDSKPSQVLPAMPLRVSPMLQTVVVVHNNDPEDAAAAAADDTAGGAVGSATISITLANAKAIGGANADGSTGGGNAAVAGVGEEGEEDVAALGEVVRTHSELRRSLRNNNQSFGRWESFLVMQMNNPLKRWRPKHFVLCGVMVAAAALPGTAALPPCGSGLWFLAVLSSLPLLAAVVMFTAIWLASYVKKTKRQAAVEKFYHPKGRDLAVQQWTLVRLVWVPCACLVAGILNGFLGSGGAFILARIALSVDTHPQVMAATLQSSVLGYAASGLGVYGVLGQVPWHMGGMLTIIAAASTLLGHLTISQYIKRTGKFWLILMILAACAVITTVLAVYNMVTVLQVVACRPSLWTAAGDVCHKVVV